MGCGQPCIGFYCYLCTCQQCGFSLSNGTCINCTFGDGKPVTCCECESPLNGRFCLFCNSRAGNSSAYDPNPNSYNDSTNFSDYTPQPQYDTYFCELCGNDAHCGYDCLPQDYRSGRIDIEIKINELKENFNEMSIKINKKKKLQQLFNSFCYDDDDDEEYTIAIIPEKPVDSLIMEDEHLNTIPEMESDEFIKSSVENLVLTPSESEDFSDIESEYDVPDCHDS
ncbi:hypothetical protein Tco_0896987 [Tanacetum coccineum]